MKEEVFIDIHTHRWPPEGPWSVCCVPPARLAEVLAARGGGVGGHPRFSSGVHPWQAADAGADGDLALLEQWADDPRVAAIGECGLDKYAPAPLARQLEVLERQAWLAERVGKPLVVHCVGRVAERGLAAARAGRALCIPSPDMRAFYLAASGASRSWRGSCSGRGARCRSGSGSTPRACAPRRWNASSWRRTKAPCP